ncbi:MAG: T9SS type A sorting domain-containing protein [Flavobacteriaceae bacterium]|nr:T9SS type A sorting domain-containing protein [Flavobacteriaceae bacterium]MDZ4148899.1 T9SS type A sorting domain-containing protein [Flavobacteriaceae bacterium]
MKKDIKYYLIVIALFGVLQISATEKVNPVNDGNTSAKTIRLSASLLQPFSNLKIVDEFGVVLYEETLKNSLETGKQINFSRLPAGNYFLEMDAAIKQVIIPLQVSDQEAILKLELKTEVFKPFVKLSGTSLLLMNFNPEQTPVTVSIYDELGQLLFEETITDSIELKRNYNFSKVESGNYSLQVKKNGKVFSFPYQG